MRSVSFAIMMGVILVTACQKNAPEPSRAKYSVLHPTERQKSAQPYEEISVPLKIKDVEGKIQLYLDHDLNLLYYQLEEGLFEVLSDYLQEDKIKEFVFLVNDYARLYTLEKPLPEKFNTIGMDKDRFDREMTKCEGKGSYAGVMICATRLLYEAIIDCIEAEGQNETDIHCW